MPEGDVDGEWRAHRALYPTTDDPMPRPTFRSPSPKCTTNRPGRWQADPATALTFEAHRTTSVQSPHRVVSSLEYATRERQELSNEKHESEEQRLRTLSARVYANLSSIVPMKNQRRRSSLYRSRALKASRSSSSYSPLPSSNLGSAQAGDLRPDKWDPHDQPLNRGLDSRSKVFTPYNHDLPNSETVCERLEHDPPRQNAQPRYQHASSAGQLGSRSRAAKVVWRPGYDSLSDDCSQPLKGRKDRLRTGTPQLPSMSEL